MARFNPRFSPLLGRVVLYLGAAYLALAFLAYGLAWQSFRYSTTDVLRTGGRAVSGRITKLSSWGFGLRKDYFLKLDNWHEEFFIPGLLLNPDWEKQGPPPVKLGSLIEEGNTIYVGASGGKKPVVLELIRREPGQPEQRIMDYRLSERRYQVVRERAIQTGKHYLTIGALILPIVILAERVGSFWFRRRSRRLKQG